MYTEHTYKINELYLWFYYVYTYIYVYIYDTHIFNMASVWLIIQLENYSEKEEKRG